ncbi:MAG: hypothetical protein JNL82_07940 [Myxococcales bacterium]|nr:hypothetical protein [Myxococcales bacterium]
MYWTSLVIFTTFLFVAAIDGFYYHLHKFRLWAHPDTWAEHVFHTARAVLTPPILWALYVAKGPSLALAAMLVGLDVVATVLDVRAEPDSRRRFGGLPRGEFLVHVVATLLHVAALATAFTAGWLGDEVPTTPAFGVLAYALVLGSSVAAVQHVALAVRGAPGACCMSRRTAA